MKKPSVKASEPYVSDHPEKDWERFKEGMRKIIGVRNRMPAEEGQEVKVYPKPKRKRPISYK